jgi:hypothetical protein
MRDEEEKKQLRGEDETRREDAKGRKSSERSREQQGKKHATERTTEHPMEKETARVADPLLVIAYMLVYLEIAWLIIVLVRSALAL